MSPAAVALATLLHAVAALALWWMAQHPPRLPASQDPVEIVFEQPAKPPPPPQPKLDLPPKPEQSPPLRGLPPPAAITSDKPTQVPPRAKELAPQRPMEALSEQPSLEQTVPPPQQEPPPPSENAFAVPKPALPPRPNPSSKSLLFKPNPPAPQTEIHPSPLMPRTQRQPPAVAHGEDPSPSPLVNPADVYNRARVADNYRWQIVRRLAGYRFHASAPVREGATTVRIVVARDGRLLDIAVAQSSGIPTIDQGVIAGVRSGSPYDPLPPEIKGDTATFYLPLVAFPDR